MVQGKRSVPKGLMPTLNGCEAVPALRVNCFQVWTVRIGRCVTPSEDVSPKKPSMVTSGPAPLRSRMDQGNRSCQSAQRRGTGSQRNSTGGVGRQMSVNRGKRTWRVPTPLLFFFADSKGLLEREPDPLDPNMERPADGKLSTGLFAYPCLGNACGVPAADRFLTL